ncbi:hypothetical protein ACFL6W_03570 [Thermodesulfobacteriota bacterium]
MTYITQCRATDKEQGFPRHSQHWVDSIKDKLKITDNQISCGPWKIKLSEIKSAHLYKIKTYHNIPYGKVLEIRTEQECFQFGLNPWAKAHEHIPINYSESECKMTTPIPYSIYSIKQKSLFLLAVIFLIFIALKLL